MLLQHSTNVGSPLQGFEHRSTCSRLMNSGESGSEANAGVSEIVTLGSSCDNMSFSNPNVVGGGCSGMKTRPSRTRALGLAVAALRELFHHGTQDGRLKVELPVLWSAI